MTSYFFRTLSPSNKSPKKDEAEDRDKNKIHRDFKRRPPNNSHVFSSSAPSKTKEDEMEARKEVIQRRLNEMTFRHQMFLQWNSIKKKNLYLPETILVSITNGEGLEAKSTEMEIKLSLVQRIFLLFHNPDFCFLSEVFSILTIVVIIISCAFYVASTAFKERPETCIDPVCDDDPDLCPDLTMCAPESLPIFDKVEKYCIIYFTIDYLIRLTLVGFMPSRLAGVIPSYFDSINVNRLLPDPEFSGAQTVVKYMTQIMNIIDLLAILPFYVSLFVASGSSISIIRILRLARVLRIFKISSMSNGVTSVSAVGILLFFTTIGIILFGSVIYFLEAGDFEVSEEYPDGAFLRWNIYRSSREESPYSSILVGCYWAMVTFTTVGYGDLFPTSPLGRFAALCLMYTGIILLALPISVIGSNFQREYERLNDISDEKGIRDEEIRTETDDALSLPRKLEVPRQQRRKSSIKGDISEMFFINNASHLRDRNNYLESIDAQLKSLSTAIMSQIEELHRKQTYIIENMNLSGKKIKSDLNGRDETVSMEGIELAMTKRGIERVEAVGENNLQASSSLLVNHLNGKSDVLSDDGDQSATATSSSAQNKTSTNKNFQISEINAPYYTANHSKDYSMIRAEFKNEFDLGQLSSEDRALYDNLLAEERCKLSR